VRIEYREPTYRSPAGPRPVPYSWIFVVHARSEQAAISGAIAWFKDMARLSSVGWVREIVSAVVL
jgi:hypothetical protein